MKRLIDLSIALAAVVILLIPAVTIALLVKLTSRGPVLHWSKRIGEGNQTFVMPKFRTMRTDTPQVATHLLVDAQKYLTPIGSALRRSSLDELPQLWNIMVGEMSLVGPRPALFNQQDLVDLRTLHGVHALVPGLTGWAQVNGRDDLSVEQKVRLDSEYLVRRSFTFDLKILWLTILRVARRNSIAH